MRLLIQRVTRARVVVGDEVVGEIGPGLLVLAGVTDTDDLSIAKKLAQKTAQLRIFEDVEGKMNLSVSETGGSVLVVSQFTLYGDARKGNRSNFLRAAGPEKAETLYRVLVEELSGILGPDRVREGRFRAMMEVELVNSGPVTLLLEEEAK